MKNKSIKDICLNKYFLLIVTTMILFIKSLLFMSILNSYDLKSFSTNFIGDAKISWQWIIFKLFIYILFALILSSVILLFKEKGRIIYLTVIDLLVSGIFILDLMYYRIYNTFLSIRHIYDPELFNPLSRKLFNINTIDGVLLIDLIVIIPICILFISKHKNKETKRGVISFCILFVLTLTSLRFANYLIDIKDVSHGQIKLFNLSWVNKETMNNLGPLGYHEYDSIVYSSDFTKFLSPLRKKEINEWINYNKENLPDNEFKGILKDKNLIFIQWDSLENIVVNKSINNQEITPELNKLLDNSIYFNNIYVQNKSGGTSDSELMINTGLLPLEKERYFLHYPNKTRYALPKILNESGYTTISARAESNGIWNWVENNKKFGNEIIWDNNNFIIDDVIGQGLSDKSFFEQIYKKIYDIESPYSIFLNTLSSRAPFNIPIEERNLKLPNELENTILGNYLNAINYTDKQIGNFITKLQEDNKLNDTVIIIYGSHSSLNKDYDLSSYNFQKFNTTELKVPVLIYNPNFSKQLIDKVGGLSDIFPTICYMLGINQEEFEGKTLGRILVNTNKDATITYNNDLVGIIEDEEQEINLENAYSISNDIIKGNFFH
ncbi:LTA synthase family protein [Clostridium perfringens]|uniref:LTA synthase family protein n=1 Tax=Clostridium perfringens TaxID=1502 RepID=UPI00244A0676|nr:LTA synthase family protein [Clostridium perfringens]MDH2475975.1 LTA synthase family protein [Clostridium perfringens]